MEDSHVAVLLEDLSHQFKAFGEGQAQHTKDIQQINIKLESMDHKIQDNSIQILAIKHDLKGVKQEVQGIKQEVQGIKQEVQEIKQEVQEIKQELKTVNVRLEKIETKITVHDKKLARV